MAKLKDSDFKDYIDGLIEKFEGSGLSELDLEIPQEFRLRLAKPPPAAQIPAFPMPALLPGQINAVSAQEVSVKAPPQAAAEAKTINAALVGTFYSAPSPEAEPYVKAGDAISKGDVLCIIEAMKTMNEIEAEAGGEIAEILIKSGSPVEYGQPMFRLK